ncbi:MAG: hypothetical protein ACXVGF_04835 [Blastococcus sp.]
MTSHRVELAARRLADQQAERLRLAALPERFVATVASVSAGEAQDGNATVTVTYRGTQVLAAGWNLAQTFAAGQRVMCSRLAHQVFIDYRIGGQP